jgi:hypothetical protein
MATQKTEITKLNMAQFALDMGSLYEEMAGKIQDVLEHNREISDSDYTVLSDDQLSLISFSNSFLTLAIDISFEGADPYYAAVQKATTQITDAIDHIQSVSNIISITAGLIGIAAGILNENGPLIATSLAAIIKTITPDN